MELLNHSTITLPEIQKKWRQLRFHRFCLTKSKTNLLKHFISAPFRSFLRAEEQLKEAERSGKLDGVREEERGKAEGRKNECLEV